MKSEAIYRGTDLARIRVSGSRILADAKDGGTFETFSLSNGNLKFDGYENVGSYSATFLDLHGYDALVSYGDVGGGVAVYDVRSSTPKLKSSDDAGLITWFAERHVVQRGLEFEAVGFLSRLATLRFTQHRRMDPNGDEGGDGIPNRSDVAPLLRP